MRVLIAAVVAEATRRPAGYLPEVFRCGVQRGKYLEVRDTDVAAIRRAFPADAGGRGAMAGRPPPWRERWAGLRAALREWRDAGYPVMQWGRMWARHRVCRTCRHNIGYGVVGGCRLCGCSGAKLLLATARCKIGKWGGK